NWLLETGIELRIKKAELHKLETEQDNATRAAIEHEIKSLEDDKFEAERHIERLEAILEKLRQFPPDTTVTREFHRKHLGPILFPNFPMEGLQE
ncbi:MAG: hypothetical protein ACREQV_13860, partial [Candidatus Binatia bacterium]